MQMLTRFNNIILTIYFCKFSGHTLNKITNIQRTPSAKISIFCSSIYLTFMSNNFNQRKLRYYMLPYTLSKIGFLRLHPNVKYYILGNLNVAIPVLCEKCRYCIFSMTFACKLYTTLIKICNISFVHAIYTAILYK